MKDTREYILESSFRLFIHRTFKEVSMKDLVDATGLSKGAFYHYFSSKEELFRELIEKYLLNKMMANYDGLERKSLKKFYTSFLEQLNKKNEHESETKDVNFVGLILEAIKLFPEMKQNFSQINQFEQDMWREVIVNSRLSGEITSEISDESIAQFFIYTKIAVGIRKNFGIEIENEKMMALKLMTLWSDFYNGLISTSNT